MRKRILVFLLAVLVIADQATKQLALAFLGPLPQEEARRIVTGFLYLKLTTNAGGVWEIFSGLGPAFFISLSAIAAVWLTLLIYRLKGEDLPFGLPLVLLLGGFIGNGIDRIRFGHVVDFIYFAWYFKPVLSTFNLADLAILGGLLWLFGLWTVRTIRYRRKATVEAP